MLSPLSDLTITLNPSTNYRWLGFLLSMVALCVLGYSDAPWVVFGVLGILTLRSLYFILNTARPHPQLQALGFHQGQWILDDHEGASERYDALNLCVDTGLFLLVRLSKPKRSRLIVIFYDQMTFSELRMLNILHTIL